MCRSCDELNTASDYAMNTCTSVQRSVKRMGRLFKQSLDNVYESRRLTHVLNHEY